MKGIVLRGDEVRALAATGEVVVRRPIVPQPPHRANVEPDGRYCIGDHPRADDCEWRQMECHMGAPGDTRFVRETMAPRLGIDGAKAPERARHYAKYRAEGITRPHDPMDWHSYPSRWTPAQSMPEWASRFTVDIVAVTAERVQSITRAGTIASGVRLPVAPVQHRPGMGYALLNVDVLPYLPADYDALDGAARLDAVSIAYFAHAWDAANRRHPWASNPWCWAATVRRKDVRDE